MYRRIKLIVLFLLISISTFLLGCGSDLSKKPTQSKKNVPSGPNLLYEHPDRDKVNVKKDIVYKIHNDNKLKLDIYYPLSTKDISKIPTVILIHGTASDDNLKDSDVYQAWGKAIAASGATAVTFNWRTSIASKDVSDLIKYVRENAKELNLNSENVCVFAFSAGVQEGVKDAMSVNTGFVKNVIVYYGKLDTSILTVKSDVKLPRFLIAMGKEDKYFAPGTNDFFMEEAKAKGCNIIKMVHSKAGHAFDVFNVGDDETKNIVSKTLKFIADSGN